MPIEEEITKNLHESGLWDSRTASKVLTGRSFAAVELSDGSVGTAMDYTHFRYDGPADGTVRILSGREAREVLRLPEDAAVRESELLSVSASGLSATEQAVKVALLSALSRPLFEPRSLTRAGLAHESIRFEQLRAAPVPARQSAHSVARAVGDASSVGVVGFGGLMELFAVMPSVERVLICDLNHERRAAYMRQVLERINAQFDSAKVHFVGPDVTRLAEECEVIQLTASSLCNGTMDDVLASCAKSRLVMVGPSGAVAPSVWFEHGVELVCTEIKDGRYTRAYEFDPHLFDWFVEYDDRLILWRQ